MSHKNSPISTKTILTLVAVGASLTAYATSTPENAAAGDNASRERLTREQCIEIALDQNPLAQAARYGVLVAEAEAGIAKAPYYPELSLNAGWSRFQRRAYLPSDLEARAPSPIIGPKSDWSAGVTARYTLYNGGQRAAELRQALALKKGAEAEATGMLQALVYEVEQSFYMFAAALQITAVAQENIERTQTHLHLAQRRHNAGAAPKADELRAEVEVAEAELALTRAESAAQTVRGQLSIAMGLPVHTRFEIDAAVARKPEFDLPDVESLIEEALEYRPELEAARRQLDAGSAGVGVAKSARRPRITAEAGFHFRDEVFLPEDEEWTAGIAVNWNIFSGFSRKHGIARAKAELSRQEAYYQRRILLVQQEVWAAYAKIQETWKAMHTTETQVADAQESLRMMRVRYEVEAATVNDLLDAQTALARAETNLAESRWDYRIARAWLERVRGINYGTDAMSERRD